jgi:hypothetical protein
VSKPSPGKAGQLVIIIITLITLAMHYLESSDQISM